MATTNGIQFGSTVTPDPGTVNGIVRCYVEKVTLAAQAIGDLVNIASVPKGAIPLYGVITTDTSLGLSTIAIGVTGSAGKYRADAVLTALTPEVFGDGGVNTVLTDTETVAITVATAALPAAGNLTVTMFYAFN